ncbi:MAG: hypothetical protein DCC67_02925 [Planctomycetota bacterium]|nr:MAG: hypothetical protein DCC67_02925 [Planctomycetota bacterium]
MEVENFTPFMPAVFVSAKAGVGYVATVLLKAAFNMQHAAPLEPLEEPLLPSGDVYSGGEPGAGFLVYASDFAPYKARADVLLAATAYRPADRPRGAFSVAVQVGGLRKQLAVSGMQQLERRALSSVVVERDPLRAIPITYENALGGPDDPANPVGRGPKSDVLPNIAYFERRTTATGNQPAPAGLGPIAPEWEPRRSFIGTFGADYLQKHWPGFPGDFNERFFNAAPLDQQIDGYLQGDEHIVLENLHPQHPIYVTRLPAWRAVCLREQEGDACELIPLAIDTLWIDCDRELLVLVWRGRMPVQTPEALEVKTLGFMVEPMQAPAGDAAHYRARLHTLIDQRDAEFEPEAPAAAAPPGAFAAETQAEPDAADATAASDEAELRDIEARVAAIQGAAGLAPEAQTPPEPRPLSPESQQKLVEIMASVEEEDRRAAAEEEARRWTREKALAAALHERSLAGADLSDVDLSRGELAGVDFRGANLARTNFAHAQLSQAVLAGCTMEEAKFDSATLDQAVLAQCNGQQASFRGASLAGADLCGADLTGAVLDGANLARASADQAVLNGASLAGAALAGATLNGAVLSGASAARADFTAASLVGAACDNATFTGAGFSKADVSDAVFASSDLSEANFDEAAAADADFTAARLDGASFRKANCEGMWLSSASAKRADFREANCTDLQVDGAQAQQANFAGATISSFRGGDRADLSSACFRGARGVDPVFENCVLDDADFSGADVPGANLVRSSALRASFQAADLRGARFDNADCQGASFVAADLFEAVFAGANLTDADLSDGSFFRAEFLDARITRLRFDRCNLNMTKLEQWAASKNK